ncbi:MAG TPA: sulfur reduction protein DsrJ [Beggiatoa sp.]|nr:MAG: hypothetical protein B6247_08520 [Beggiatoa sp. 4572_84]RKZ63312.1 MAG: sulfur reduction protein DsrJ [Gammaproteobacteria bacterium]HEW98257.1 sulfur reduction protein DsrJ [Beggiatoa sp.]
MKVRLKLSTLGKLGIGLLLSLAVSAAEPTSSGRVPIPKPPKAKEPFSAEQPCVEPIDDIRRNHGHYLKHHRDDTVHSGVRTTKHSLEACINCHVTKDAAGNYPSIKTGEHFCRSCHIYAAVTIDCFQCHASRSNEPSQ